VDRLIPPNYSKGVLGEVVQELLDIRIPRTVAQVPGRVLYSGRVCRVSGRRVEHR
jgi:hypothetical protein